jgi:light-harvesting complex I chlorophyll a/b binding protein 1
MISSSAFFFLLVFLIFAAVVSSFQQPPQRCLVNQKSFEKTPSIKIKSHLAAKKLLETAPIKMISEDFLGVLPPTGFFDPLGLSAGRPDDELKLWREAELKHGRVAMLAANGIIMSENFNPLFGGKVTGAAIYHFQQIESLFPPFWYFLVFGIGIIEGWNILRGWEPYGQTTGQFGVANLKEDYENGDLGKVFLAPNHDVLKSDSWYLSPLPQVLIL